MFKLNPNPTFVAAVPLSVPGMAEPLEVSFTFRHQNKAALSKWMTDAKGKSGSENLHKIIADWVGVFGEDGLQVPYSLTALTDLLENYSAAEGEIFRAYMQELTEAKRKN